MDDPARSTKLDLEISQRQTSLSIEPSRLRRRLLTLLANEGVNSGEVSVVVVDHDQMHALNRQYLNHDYPTDVLSFLFHRSGDSIVGEIIVSGEMALDRADEFDWSPEAELTLYAVHGALHLVGYLDKRPEDVEQMRQREQYYLERFGLSESSGHADENGPGAVRR